MILNKKKIGRLEFIITFIANRFFIKTNLDFAKTKKYPLAVFAHEPISHKIFLYNYYELEDLEDTIKLMNIFSVDVQNSIAIDVGANIGNHSIFYSYHFNHVLAFEANPITYKILDFNLSFYKNANSYSTALSSSNGIANLWVQEHNPGRSSLKYEHKQAYSIQVNCQKLDNFKEKIASIKSKVGLIKLDVEGFEKDVLTGSKEIISTYRPIIAFEQRSREFSDYTDETETINLLRDWNYIILTVDDSRKTYHPFFQMLFITIFGRVIIRKIKIAEIVEKGNYPLLYAVPAEIFKKLDIEKFK